VRIQAVCGRQVSGNGERGVAVVQLLRRWVVEQRDEPVDSCDWVTVADGVIDDGIPRDAGMSTVEYAVGTVVAAAFAAVLYKIVTGDSVVAGLTGLINSALHTSL